MTGLWRGSFNAKLCGRIPAAAWPFGAIVVHVRLGLSWLAMTRIASSVLIVGMFVIGMTDGARAQGADIKAKSLDERTAILLGKQKCHDEPSYCTLKVRASSGGTTTTHYPAPRKSAISNANRLRACQGNGQSTGERRERGLRRS